MHSKNSATHTHKIQHFLSPIIRSVECEMTGGGEEWLMKKRYTQTTENENDNVKKSTQIS